MSSNLTDFDTEELVREIFANGNYELDTDELEQILFDAVAVDFEQFKAVANVLIRYTPIVTSPLTGCLFHAFLKDGIALAKVKASQDYQERGE